MINSQGYFYQVIKTLTIDTKIFSAFC